MSCGSWLCRRGCARYVVSGCRSNYSGAKRKGSFCATPMRQAKLQANGRSATVAWASNTRRSRHERRKKGADPHPTPPSTAKATAYKTRTSSAAKGWFLQGHATKKRSAHLVRPEKGRLLRSQAVHVLGNLGRHLGRRRHADSVARDDVLEHRVLGQNREVADAMVVVLDLAGKTWGRFGFFYVHRTAGAVEL